MSLVHVIFPDLEAGSSEHSYPADSQDDLLLQPIPLVASIQERSNFSVLESVAFHIGVEEQDGDQSSCRTSVVVEPSCYPHLSALNLYADLVW